MVFASTFCGSPTFQYVNASHNDLDICFQGILFSCITLSLAFTLGLYTLLRFPRHIIHGFASRGVIQEAGIVRVHRNKCRVAHARLILSICITCLPPLLLFADWLESRNPMYGFVYFRIGSHILSWLIFTILLREESKRRLADSPALKIFWAVSFVLTLKTMVSMVLLSKSGEDWAHDDRYDLNPTQVWIWFWVAAECIIMVLMILLAVLNLRRNVFATCLEQDIEFDEEEVEDLLDNQEEGVRNEGASSKEVWNTWLNIGINSTAQEVKSPPTKSPNNPRLRNGIISVSIPTWMELSSSNEKGHVKYAIKVKSIHAGSWTVWKRYNEFLGFHEKLSLMNSSSPLPVFPEKNRSPNIESRRDLLEQYLLSLLTQNQFTGEVNDFLGLKEKLAAQAGARSRRSSTSNEANRLRSLSISAEDEKNSLRRFSDPMIIQDDLVSLPVVANASKVVFLGCKILEFDVWKTEIGTLFVSYTVSISSSAGKWNLRKRFKDFLELNLYMLGRFRHNVDIVPRFPAKEQPADASLNDLDRERAQLEFFLKKIISGTEFQCAELDEFLRKPDEPFESEQWLEASPESPTYKAKKYRPVEETPNSEQVVEEKVAVEIPLPAKPKRKSLHHFEAKVLRWELMNADSIVDSFVQYEIQISEFFSLYDYISWKISKRYQEFDALHKALVARFPAEKLPPLPPKRAHLIRDNSKAFHDERSVLLEKYLEGLCETSEFHCNELFTFLELNNPNRAISAGTLAASNS